MSDKQPHPFSRKAFCERWGISHQTFYDEVKRGRLTIRKIGSRTIVTPEDEQAWLDSLPTEVSPSNNPWGGQGKPTGDAA
ncbi:helix-turn-helix domain-containing protein [Pseudohaliea sp.]|uniref:helix-turn-helix transcriptional regulator n=1 Tax=Pseudohaliea sp. TaxID=2740289 RepID=UPI0032EFF6B8